MRLEQNDKLCCLGVACRVAIENGIDLATGSYCGNVVTFDSCCSTLPKKVMAWLGLQTDCGAYECTALSQINDAGASFARIADIIESMPPGLFVEVLT